MRGLADRRAGVTREGGPTSPRKAWWGSVVAQLHRRQEMEKAYHKPNLGYLAPTMADASNSKAALLSETIWIGF